MTGTTLPPASALSPQRYKVQFTATQEYVDLLEEARDLLSRAVSGRSLEQVHLRAMRSLVTELRKHRYAATAKSHATASDSGDTDTDHAEDRLPRRRGKAQPHAVEGPTDPRRRGRYISAAVRRAVWKRDGGRCAYVDAAGQRCRETAFLEWQHKHPYARGGPPTESNIELLCAAHNALAAEDDFGRDFMNETKVAASRGSGTGTTIQAE